MKTLAAIQSFLANRRALNRRLKTLQWYQCCLTRFACLYPELPLTPEPIEEFLGSIIGEPETRHGYYRCIKALYRFICRRNLLPNPVELIAPPSRPEKLKPTLDKHELIQLLSAAPSLREKTILTLFIDTGIRTSELTGLRRQDIKLDNIVVTGKGGNQRKVWVSEETRRLLMAMQAINGHSEYIFSVSGMPPSRFHIYRLVHQLMLKAGISGPKLGPHRLRHAFGKNYLVNGGDTRSLQRLMGHASITTTEDYTHLADDELMAKHHQFTPLRSAQAAVQGSLDAALAIKEVEAILAQKGNERNDNRQSHRNLTAS